MEKILSIPLNRLEKGKKYPVGTVRMWKDGPRVKTQEGEWIPVRSVQSPVGRSGDDGGSKTSYLMREYEEVKNRYQGTPLWMKAPNGEPTNLTERQWIQIRTPSFKKWFGDWEGAEKSRMVENLVPFQLDGTPIVKDKAALEDVFRSFGVVKNVTDEKYVNFPVGMAGKICAHRGFDQLQIAGGYNKLFETSVPMYFKKEQIRDGHKRHPETAGYHHYINTFRYGDKQYYVRFTVKEQKTKPGRENLYYTHSAFISDVEIYKKGADYSTGGRVIDPVLMEVSTPSDDILSEWLGEVKKSKEEASKVVDKNGEPMVVYHGTNRPGFNEFITIRGTQRENGGRGIHFGTIEQATNVNTNGETTGIYPVYLSIQNPLRVTDAQADWNGKLAEELQKRGYIDQDRVEEFGKYQDKADTPINDRRMIRLLQSLGFDGLVYNNEAEGVGDSYVVFEPEQIKSVNNQGTFDKSSPDIRKSIFIPGERVYRLEKAAHKLHYKTEFQGLPISIENRKGSIRRWYDPLEDRHGETKFKYPYGYIRLTEGEDGDHIDVYLGPDGESQHVFIVRQNDPTTGLYDEDKVMMGFRSMDEARRAYLEHYDNPAFLGDIDYLPMVAFKKKIGGRVPGRIEKARQGLVPKKIMVTNSKGKTFQKTVWVKPSDKYNVKNQQAQGAPDELKDNRDVYTNVLGELEPNAVISVFGSQYGNPGGGAYFSLGSGGNHPEKTWPYNNKDVGHIVKEMESMGYKCSVGKDGYGAPTINCEHIATKNKLDEMMGRHDKRWKDAKSIFLRYGDIPEDERSTDWSSGNKEKGVSVFRGKILPDGSVLPMPNTNQELGSLLTMNSRPIYVIEGEEIGTGTDGEPVLINVKKHEPKEYAKKVFSEEGSGDIPGKGFFSYQNENMENTNKELFSVPGANYAHAERIENAGDILRELTLRATPDHSYIGEKLWKLSRVIDVDKPGNRVHISDFMGKPETPESEEIVAEILKRYKKQFDGYKAPLGKLGELSKQLSFAVIDQDIKRMRSGWIDFVVEYDKFRENQGYEPYYKKKLSERLQKDIADRESLPNK